MMLSNYSKERPQPFEVKCRLCEGLFVAGGLSQGQQETQHPKKGRRGKAGLSRWMGAGVEGPEAACLDGDQMRPAHQRARGAENRSVCVKIQPFLGSKSGKMHLGASLP